MTDGQTIRPSGRPTEWLIESRVRVQKEEEIRDRALKKEREKSSGNDARGIMLSFKTAHAYSAGVATDEIHVHNAHVSKSEAW